MKILRFRLSAFAAICVILAFGVSAQATLINGTIDNGPFYSLIHAGTDAYDPGDPDDWLFFAPGASFVFDLTDGIVSTSGSQFYSLASENGASADIEIVSLFIDTNNADGFVGGSLDFVLDGTAGTFLFAGERYGGTNYNSSVFDGTNFRAFAWGADLANDLSMDFVFSGTILPEPGTLGLLALGALGCVVARRRRG